MNIHTDSIAPATARCPMHGLLPDDDVDASLRRASDVERELPADAPLVLTLRWVREFLARPHPDVGRAGPVCPFSPAALAMDTIWLTEVADDAPNRERIVELIGRYRDAFLEIEPREGAMSLNKTILVVFPNLGADGAALVDDVQAELKASFVDVGLMLGEFHAQNESPGLRNPDFRPLRSPVPMLAIRHMVESDLPFLQRSIDAPSVRAAYLRSYLRRLGGTIRPKYFDQAVTALADAIHATAKPKRAAVPKTARAPREEAIADDVAR